MGEASRDSQYDLNPLSALGLEFLEVVKLERLCVDAQIIMITTENSPEHLARAKAAGSNGNISKPFTNEQVQSVPKPLFS